MPVSMDALQDFAEGLGDSIGEGVFKITKQRRRGHGQDFGLKPQVGQFLRDRENESGAGQRIYTEHLPAKLPQNKNTKRDTQAIHKYLDRSLAPIFDRYPSLKVTNVLIQSPLLRRELRPILERYDPKLDFDNEDGIDFTAPFEPLYFARHAIWHRFKQVKDLKEQLGDEEDSDITGTYDHLKLLIEEVLQDGTTMAKLIEEADRLSQEKKITYHLLWTLFPPTSVVLAKDVAGHQQAYEVTSFDFVSMEDDSRAPIMFDMACRYVEFDSHRFGYSTKALTVGYFSGKKDIKDLDVQPLENIAQHVNLKKQIIERGKKVLDYQDVQHVQISPLPIPDSLTNHDQMLKDLRRVDDHGRAIVDFFTGARRNKQWRKTVAPLHDAKPLRDAQSESQRSKGKGKMPREGSDDDSDMRDSGSLVDVPERSIDRAPTKEELDSSTRPSKTAQEENRRLVGLDDKHLLLMSPLLHAFSLQSKKWITVDVDRVASVSFHTSEFDHLVTDEKYKTRLLSLVKSPLFASDMLMPEDSITQKGRGLVVLLSGPPGVGKTLMAESIAEKAERPLYYVDARDLGSDIATITENFGIIMQNAREWNAVVLLDEADIYLQKRYTLSDFQSSDRTTAFLRQLEYFQGILFLTTNLPETIDLAILSRIQITLPFPALTQSYRIRIWAHFLASVPIAQREVTKDHVRELGQWDINGRQIKNAFRMCGASCQQDRQKMSLSILEDMIGMSCPGATKDPRDPAAESVEFSIECKTRDFRPGLPNRATSNATATNDSARANARRSILAAGSKHSEVSAEPSTRNRIFDCPTDRSSTGPVTRSKKPPKVPSKPSKLL